MLNFVDTTTETLLCYSCCKKQLFCIIFLFTTEVNKIRLATTQVRPGPGRGSWGVSRLHFRILLKRGTLGMNCHSSRPGLHFNLLLLRSPWGGTPGADPAPQLCRRPPQVGSPRANNPRISCAPWQKKVCHKQQTRPFFQWEAQRKSCELLAVGGELC